MSRPRTDPIQEARKNFIREVKIGRLRYDMRQSDLADHIGVCPSVMSELLSNPDKISVGRLRGIIAATDISPAVILTLLGYTAKQAKEALEEVDCKPA